MSSSTDTHVDTGDTDAETAEDVEELEAEVERAHKRLDAQAAQIEDLMDALAAEREERSRIENELHVRDEQIADLQDEVSRLDSRTDLLELVDDAEELDGTQRATVLIQHLHQKAKARERRDKPPTAKIDREGAEDALHYPSDLDRTTFYKDMDRAARLVGDDDILEYDEGWLTLDLEGGSLPSRFTGSPEVQ